MHIANQSDSFPGLLSSLLTWTGPKVSPLALDPGVLDVSLIVIAFDSAITVPEIEPVLIWILNLSGPSEVISSAMVIVIEPLLLFTEKTPFKFAGLKSVEATVPSSSYIV